MRMLAPVVSPNAAGWSTVKSTRTWSCVELDGLDLDPP